VQKYSLRYCCKTSSDDIQVKQLLLKGNGGGLIICGDAVNTGDNGTSVGGLLYGGNNNDDNSGKSIMKISYTGIQ
jgi:hypothetical protein